MKILNIALVLATVACIFAEASTMKERSLFKRQADPTVCATHLQAIKFFNNVLKTSYEGLKALVTIIPGATAKEASPVNDALEKFIADLKPTETDMFLVTKTTQDLKTTINSLRVIPIVAKSDTIVSIIADSIANSAKNSEALLEAYIKAGCTK